MTANISGLRLTLADGTDLADKIDPRFIELSLSEKQGEESDALELTLHNHDGKLAPVKRGVFLTLSIGWISGDDVKTGMVVKGKFKVDEVERSGPPDVVVIRARAADLTSDYRKRKDKAWKETTLGDILQEIAALEGAEAQVHPDLAQIEIDIIEQANKSNMLFVRDLGRRFDAVATWKNRVLIFMPIGSETTASGKAIPSLTLTKRDGWDWNFREASRDDYDGASAKYHDLDSGKTKTEKTGGKKLKKLPRTYANKADAKRAAKSEAARKKRETVNFTYDLTLGDPEMIPNRKVVLDGWDSEIDAVKWLVKEATHTLGKDGLRTSLTLEGAG